MMKPAKDRVWCDGPDPLNRAKRWGISARDTTRQTDVTGLG
jgi:hypothetical protein